MAWSGLGANYANVGPTTQANYTSGLSSLRGYTDKVRIHMPDYQDSSSTTVDIALTQTAKALGFKKVLWGISSNRYNDPTRLITQRTWPTFRAAIVSNASVAQSNGVTDYQCGNEEELHIYAVPTSMVRTSNVVTAVFPFTLDYQVGDTVYVADATPSDFNGTFTLASTNGTTLTWAQTAANNTATASKLTDFTKAQLRTNLRGVVSDVKIVFSGAVSTAVSQDDYIGWVTDATIGSFDYITYNIYGENSLGTFITQTQALVTAFPGLVKVSEFSVNSNWVNTNVNGKKPTDPGFDEAYRYSMINRINLLVGMGIPEAYIFTWQDSANKWAIKQLTGGNRSLDSAFTGRINYTTVDY